jgi:hypothetical protein
MAVNVINFGADPDRATWETVAKLSGGGYRNVATSAFPDLAGAVNTLSAPSRPPAVAGCERNVFCTDVPLMSVVTYSECIGNSARCDVIRIQVPFELYAQQIRRQRFRE